MIKKIKTYLRKVRKYWNRDLSWIDFKGPAAVACVNMKEYLKKREAKKQIEKLKKIKQRRRVHFTIDGPGVMETKAEYIMVKDEVKRQMAALPGLREHIIKRRR